MPTDQQATPKLRWYQFSLRSLFIVTTAFAAFLSWQSCLEYRRQAVIAEIKALGGNVSVAEPTLLHLYPFFPGERVAEVTIPYSEAKKFDVDDLCVFPSIQTITFNDVQIENS